MQQPQPWGQQQQQQQQRYAVGAHQPSMGPGAAWPQQGPPQQHASSSQPWPIPAHGGAHLHTHPHPHPHQQPPGSLQAHGAAHTYGFGPTSDATLMAAPSHAQPAVAPAAAADPADHLRAVSDLPAAFHPAFNYRFFNPVQSECFAAAFESDLNMVVSAPTGAGKTGVMELAMLRLLSKHLKRGASGGPPQLQRLAGSHKIVYLGPIKALVHERQADWQARYGAALGLKVVQLSGDDAEELDDNLDAADVICATPEKFDQVTRKVTEKGNMGFFAEIGLVLLDEVHLLNEAGRGSSLEAGCVCRIKAIAAFPQLASAAIASVRFVAVSATIPNIGDIARWLGVPPAGLRQYGDELRPCTLTTHVKGYAPAKNDFLFERRLNDHVFAIISAHSKGRPALVFCSSRKGTMDAAAALAREAGAGAPAAGHFAGGTVTGSVFVRNGQQQQRLRLAATKTQAKALAAALVAGVGFHNAAMEPADRALVEELFKAGDLAVLCTTSTLAMGVNLPAHLVVLKGTVRWAGDQEVAPGEQPGYKEYSQTEVLQMVGRAGRPQFDTEGVAVIMTSRDSTSRYQRLLAGQVVESCLMANLPEHLNAEIVLGTIQDVPQAVAWIKSTFLFTRVRANPQHYGLKLRAGATEQEVDALLRDQLLKQSVSELVKYQLVESDEDGYSLKATNAGKLMAGNFLKLRTMASIVSLGERPNVPSLLRVICAAEEFRGATLRRSEKKLLNEINHSKEAEQLRFHVMADKDSSRVKERIATAGEKLFILLNNGLADRGAELDYSMRQEQDRLLVVGQRIAKCMAKFYALKGSYSSAGRSLLLARSLRNRLWDDSGATVRQLPSVGRLLGARLAAAGLGSLHSVAACDAHRLEVAAQKPYPWGSELLASLQAVTPPAVTVELKCLQALPGGRGYSCQVTLTRAAAASAAAGAGSAHASSGAAAGVNWHGRAAAAAAAGGASGARSSGRSFSPCRLLVGCSSTDEILLLRSVVLEKLESPLTLPFKVQVPRGASQPLQLSAMLLHERLIGFDMKASCLVGGGGGGTATPGSRSLSSRRAGDEAEQHGACAAAMASPGAGGSRAHDDDEEAGGVSPDQWNAAAEAARLVQQKQSRANKRRHVAALAPTPNADAGDEVDAAPDDRAPQHKRSHTTLRWMQQPVAQQLSAPVGQVAPAPLQQQRGGFGAGIAARYQQAFHAQPHPAKEPAPVAAAAAVAADAGQAAAAVDAAGVQVTPSPSSTTQQQSPAAASTAAVGAALCAAASSNLCADDMLQQLPAGMGSLFDLLAEADEAGEDAPDSKQQHPHVHGTAQRTSPAPAAMLLPRAPAPWLAMPGEQRQQPQEPEHQRSSSSSAVLRGSRLINQQQQQQPRRQQQSQSQSASCIFGAAVMKSHKVGMLRPQAGHVPGSAALPPGAMVPTTELGGSARAAGSAAVSLAAAAQPLCEQELCTPPRQIVKPAFADMSTSAPMPTGGGGSYSSSASRQSAASRWQLPQPGAGSAAKAGQRACHVLQQAPSQSAQQQRPLPDLGRFAFTAASGQPGSTQAAAAFRPSQNTLLFGHQGAAPRPSAAPQQPAHALNSSSSGSSRAHSAAVQQQLPAAAVPWDEYMAAGAEARPAGSALTATMRAAWQAPQGQQPRWLKPPSLLAPAPARAQAPVVTSSRMIDVPGIKAAAAAADAGATLPVVARTPLVLQHGAVRCETSLAPRTLPPAAQPAPPPPVAATVDAAGDDELDLGDIFAFMR